MENKQLSLISDQTLKLYKTWHFPLWWILDYYALKQYKNNTINENWLNNTQSITKS